MFGQQYCHFFLNKKTKQTASQQTKTNCFIKVQVKS